jgi:hypothetical protein
MVRLRNTSPAPEPRVLRARGVTLADPPAAPAATPAAEGEAPAAAPVAEVPQQKWIQVATSGVYKGHGDDDFTLDKAVFDKFVANLRSDPRYKAGADGVGMQPVVPFDYEHVSEMDPREGSVPVDGVPSPAWALDFKVEGDDTASSLWAFVKFGEKVRKQIEAEEYMFVSIAFTLEATDPNTNDPIGPLITSIAFTNHPFLRDLQPLAASARRAAPGATRGIQKLSYYYGDAARSPEEGFEYSRSILNLPASTTTAEVLAQIAIVIGWVIAPGTEPAGVDIGELMSKLRACWTVPVTWSAQQVLEEITKAAEALKPAAASSETPVTPPAPAPESAPVTNSNPSPAAVAPPAALTNTEPNAMDLKKLATLFNSAHSKGKTLLDASDAPAVEAAIEGAVKDQATLASLLEALGVTNASDALKSISDLTGSRSKLADALAQLDQVLAMQTEVDAATEAQDVGAAMSAGGLNPEDARVRKAFSVQRSTAIATALAAVKEEDRKNPKALGTARKEARRAFLAEHGVADQTREHLLTNIVAGPGPAGGSQQLDPPARSIPLSRSSNGGAARGISLVGVRGPNVFHRLATWVQANEKGPNGQVLSWDAACKRASELKADSTVAIDEST